MGVTILSAITFWLASSFVEYKIVSTWPALTKLFSGVPGMVISVIIGTLVGFAIGGAFGVGAGLGQMIGLATNSFTFQLYSGLAKCCAVLKSGAEQVRSAAARFSDLWAQVGDTLKMAATTIGAIIVGIAWVLAIPAKIARLINNNNKKEAL